MEHWIARVIGGLLSLLGVGLLSVYPLTRLAASRDESDINRALAPLLKVPLDQLQTPIARSLVVIIPNDDQWQRIIRRFGQPAFVFVVVDDDGLSNERVYSAAEVGLDLQVRRNGIEIALTTELQSPEDYSAHANTLKAIKLSAAPGDTLQVTARVHTTAPGSQVLLVTPNWGITVSHWAEGAGIDSAVRQLLAVGAAMAGLIIVWWGLTFLWGRPESTA